MATVEQLLHDLTAGDYFERSNAARALGAVDDPRVTRALLDALGDEDEWVVESAAESLAQRNDAAAAAGLAALLDHKHYKVRTAAANALGALGQPESLAALRAHAQDSDSWVREAVQEAIRDIESGGRVERRVTVAGTMQAVSPRPPDAGATPADPAGLISAAATRMHAQQKRLADGSHLLRVTLSSGRHQKIRAVTNETTSGGLQRIRLLTILAPATEKLMTWAMRQNIRITHGAIGLLRLRKRDYLVLTRTLLLRDATLDRLVDVIEGVARRGDRLEEALTHRDAW